MTDRFLTGRERLGALLVGTALAVSVAAGGLTRTAENTIRSGLFSLTSRDATGQLHVVEMDAASIGSIKRWPWPRRHYAAVIDELHRAGAASITFDVDFSSTSTPIDDEMLASAIARADGTVALPTFTQNAGSGSDRLLDALPIEPFRENAALAAVSVDPDADGLVRNMLLGTTTAGLPRPSLSALIAHRQGLADQQFPIDYSIDPGSIPRHSFLAIARGRFDPAEVRGKDILIGATAIEMGDRYAVPRHGVLPGVIVQAIATETLYRGVPRHAGWTLPIILAAALGFWAVGGRSINRTAARCAGAVAVILGAFAAAWTTALVLPEIAPALLLVVTASAGRMIVLFKRGLDERRTRDHETGLPNSLALAATAVTASDGFTVTAVIDGYDRLRTVLGSAGSTLLVQRVAERLRTVADAGEVYRIEDRAFAWLALVEHHVLEDTLTRLAAIMRSPIEVEGRRVDVMLHFGIADTGAISEAALAASEALRTGQPWCYHVATERAALERQVSLMGELDAAIGRNELDVLYQPKLELASNRITGVEALIRWNHPERGYLRPDMFIPLAEESDRIADLTLFVLARTIEDLGKWCAEGLVIKAAVNISARLVTSQSFTAAAEALLGRMNVPRHRLVFEVTESATIADPAAAAAALRQFKDLGIGISMDDYGTGQSTLSYLKQLPLSELKIDRSFVQFAHRDQGDAVLVRSTVNLAHELGLAVVAEGVEEPECLAFIRSVGCDFAQGYLIGKPMAALDLLAVATQEVRVAA